MDELAQRLLSLHPEICEIVVFGSFAEGTFAPGSDLDVLILLDRSDRPVRDRIPLYLPGAFPVGLDLFPFTRDEIAARADSPVLKGRAQEPLALRASARLRLIAMAARPGLGTPDHGQGDVFSRSIRALS